MSSVGINGSDPLLKITVSGKAGSGTSTLVEGLCERNGWSFMNGGIIFRTEAEKRQMDLASFGELCKQDLSVDRGLDQALKGFILDEEGPEVVESRLAGWWSHQLKMDGIRLWLEVSLEERARRVVAREGGSIELKILEIEAREHLDLQRFMELYNLDPSDPTPYTNILNTDTMSIEEVLAAVCNIIDGDG